MSLPAVIRTRLASLVAAVALGLGVTITHPGVADAALLDVLVCQAGTQADFAVVGGQVKGIYIGAYRSCTSPIPEYQKYGSWSILAKDINVTDNCSRTHFQGIAAMTWVNRQTMQTEPGTVRFVIDLPTAKLSFIVASGPFSGKTISAAVVPTGVSFLKCPNGTDGIQHLRIDGLGIFRQA